MEQVEPSDVPPIEPGTLEDVEPASRWPTVIGVISMVYAVLGLLCSVGYAISTFMMEALMRMGGLEVTAPPVIKVVGLVTSAAMFLLGVLMVFGAAGLLRRTRRGVVLLKRWVLLRVMLLAASAVLGVLLAPASVQMQKSIEESQIRQLEEAGQSGVMKPKTDQEHWRQLMIQSAVMLAVTAVYPVFLGVFLSRRKISEEVATWR